MISFTILCAIYLTFLSVKTFLGENDLTFQSVKGSLSVPAYLLIDGEMIYSFSFRADKANKRACL